MDVPTLRRAVVDLGALLQERSPAYELVVIGGAMLLLRGMVTRAVTKDIDILGSLHGDEVRPLRPFPGPLRQAATDIAALHGLAAGWIDTGPDTLLDLGLPMGFAGRLISERFGTLTLHYASRADTICFKVYAAVDHWPDTRTRHMGDLRELQPDREELLAAARWTRSHDPSDGYRQNLLLALRYLADEDADGHV